MNCKMEEISQKFGTWAKERGAVLVTAESCTAGLIAATVAMTSGSSAWLDRGFVVYTAEAKHDMLGVNYSTIERYDITSEEVAVEMVEGALSRSNADVAISVTGVAGPNGGTEKIPVGTVCIAYKILTDDVDFKYSETKVFTGTRNEIRDAVVIHTLEKIMQIFDECK